MTRPSLKIAPSLLSADSLRLGEELAAVEAAGADWHHVDVMDGHFVPNLTYGPPLVRALKASVRLPLDVHIMIDNPDAMGLAYVEAGADSLTFHVEAARHAHRLIAALQAAGAKAGVALNPGTSVESLRPLLPFVDLVLVMSVNPGFGGQSFIDESVGRVRWVHQALLDAGRREQCVIQVDGGINASTAAAVVEAGADALVAGNAIYRQDDRAAAIRSLRIDTAGGGASV